MKFRTRETVDAMQWDGTEEGFHGLLKWLDDRPLLVDAEMVITDSDFTFVRILRGSDEARLHVYKSDWLIIGSGNNLQVVDDVRFLEGFERVDP